MVDSILSLTSFSFNVAQFTEVSQHFNLIHKKGHAYIYICEELNVKYQ